MIDTEAFKKSNDKQTEKAFLIANSVLEKGYAAAVSGGCARRHIGLSEWMNDADILTNAPIELLCSICDEVGIRKRWVADYKVTCVDELGFYDVVRRDDKGDDSSTFNRHELDWRFHHRAIVLDPVTRQIVPQIGEDLIITNDVIVRGDKKRLLSKDPYWSYMGLSYACREDVVFDEELMNLMVTEPNLDFFSGLCFKIISYTILGKNPSKGMDRLLASNLLRKLPILEKYWSEAGESTREALDVSNTCFVAPWMVLLKMHPSVCEDLMKIHFPEQWLVHCMTEDRFFPLFDKNERNQSWWSYWHIKKMYQDIAFPPEEVLKTKKITDRPTPFPFP